MCFVVDLRSEASKQAEALRAEHAAQLQALSVKQAADAESAAAALAKACADTQTMTAKHDAMAVLAAERLESVRSLEAQLAASQARYEALQVCLYLCIINSCYGLMRRALCMHCKQRLIIIPVRISFQESAASAKSYSDTLLDDARTQLSAAKQDASTRSAAEVASMAQEITNLKDQLGASSDARATLQVRDDFMTCSPVPWGTYVMDPLKKELFFCDLSLREKDCCSRACGAQAT